MYLALLVCISLTPANFAFINAPTPEMTLAVAANAAQGKNALEGFVYDSARRPVPNVRIELLDQVDSTIATALTTTSGRYGFYNLSSGTYQIRVLPHADFQGQTIRIALSNFSVGAGNLEGGAAASGGQREQVDIVLKTRAAADATKAPSTAFAQEVPQAARTAFDNAVVSLDGNDADKGIAELKQAVEIFPKYYMALERLGAEYVKRQQYDLAVAALKKAVEINPKGHTSFYALGVAQYQLKQLPEATESLQRALALAPDSPNAAFLHMYLGIALVKQGKPSEAETHLKQAHERGGKLVPDVHMHLAQMYSNNKKYKEAADELEVFLKEMPNARDAENIKNIIKTLRAKASN